MEWVEAGDAVTRPAHHYSICVPGSNTLSILPLFSILSYFSSIRRVVWPYCSLCCSRPCLLPKTVTKEARRTGELLTPLSSMTHLKLSRFEKFWAIVFFALLIVASIMIALASFDFFVLMVAFAFIVAAIIQVLRGRKRQPTQSTTTKSGTAS